MTDSILDQIADCVAADLQAGFGAGRLSQTIIAEVGYVPVFTPADQDVGTYQVFIRPEKDEQAGLNRGRALKIAYMIEVGVCCRLPDKQRSTIRPAMFLIQQMADFFATWGLSDPLASWTENEVFYWGDPEQLNYDGTFFALWSYKFEGSRTTT